MKTVHINAWTDCISIFLSLYLSYRVFSGPQLRDIEHCSTTLLSYMGM